MFHHALYTLVLLYFIPTKQKSNVARLQPLSSPVVGCLLGERRPKEEGDDQIERIRPSLKFCTPNKNVILSQPRKSDNTNGSKTLKDFE